jgi:glutaconate CoA-transferase, subunit A
MSVPAVLDLAEAVQCYVKDGDVVYVGNFGTQLFTVGHELIRQRRRELHVVVPSGGLLLDQLLGAGCVGAATFGHCWSSIGPRPTWNFRRRYEQQQDSVRWYELSLGALSAALLAGAWRVPFMPVAVSSQTAYLAEGLANGRLSQASSEFGTATIVRAIRPRVAFIYADRVDRWGNAVILGPQSDVSAAAQAADEVVVVAEELVSEAQVRATPAAIPGVLVSAVVIAPGAVRPDGATRRYPRDVTAITDYCLRTATPEGFSSWLDAEVFG